MTQDTLAHPLIDDYFRDLERAASVLPWHERHDLISEIRGHITEALAATTPTDAAVRRLLDELGEPREIVAAARPESAGSTADQARARPAEPQGPATPERTVPPAPQHTAPAAATQPGPGGLEIAAVLLLLLGGVVLPFFGWVIGVVLLWSSNAWTTWQKVLGTLVVPGGLGVPAAMTFLVSPFAYPLFGSLFFAAVAVLPLAVAAYLLWAANRDPDAFPQISPLRESR